MVNLAMNAKACFTKPFGELSKDDGAIAGGKGASLGEMTQAGIPVPPGFVVLAGAFEQFIGETDLVQEIDAILHGVNHQEIHTVEQASEEIKVLILSAAMPADIASEIQTQFKKLGTKFVAVRSSATAEDSSAAAWAGQLESYLNTTEADLLERVKCCWASLFTPRAIFYRFEKGLHHTKISVAVVIQKMVESEISGIAFSVHPVTEDYNQLIIEAGFGLGEAIVSGSVTPDSYVVEKEPRRILDINIATQNRSLIRANGGIGNEWVEIPEPRASAQVLTQEQILELADLVLAIETHYGFPCDIEWAFEKGKFYIVQSRPITTLQQKKEVESRDSKKEKLDKENLIFLGRWIAPVLEYEAWLDWARTPEAKKLKIKNHDFDSVSVDGHFYMSKEGAYPYIREKTLSEFEDDEYNTAEIILNITEKLCEECVQLSKEFASKKKLNFSDFKNAFQLIQRLRFPWMACFAISEAADKLIKEYARTNNKEIDEIKNQIPQVNNSLSDDQEKLFQFKKEILKNKLVFIFSEIEKKKPELAEEIKKYQKETAYIGTHHFWGEPRTTGRLLEAVQNSHFEKFEHKETPRDLIKFADVVAKTTKWRLECAQSSAQLAFALRPYLTELGSRIGRSFDDILFCLTDEIKKIEEGEMKETPFIDGRKKAFGIYRMAGVTHIVVAEALEQLETNFGLKESFENVSLIKGNIGNKGKVKGVVAIVLRPTDNAKVQKGMVLVAPETTPDFIPAMGKAAAFITDLGGITSHAAIVAREMNKPCIIGTKNATKILKDGDMVEVDADNGTVKIIK